MANFKGGFAFNNEAAKVEVEQAPDGTLISCVNPVTGESLGGGGGVGEVVFEGSLAFTNTTDLNDYLSPADFESEDAYVFFVQSLNVNNRSMDFQQTWTFAVFYSNVFDFSAASFHVKDSNDDYDYNIVVVYNPLGSMNITSGALSVAGTITKIIKISA